VTLDDTGAATVELPAWFEALNRDLTYQLTPIGGAAPSLHIAGELLDNRFQIAGGAPGSKVSWRVSGIRQDAWALAHPLEVEPNKPAEEQGAYPHPEVHGQPADMGTSALRQRLRDARFETDPAQGTPGD
jgi:hypothetical protein